MIKRLLFVMVFLSSMSPILKVAAQNNPFGVKDALYSYVLKTSAHIDEHVGYLMTDTLYEKAKGMKDLNGQCLALDFKVWHFHKNGQHERERKEFERVAPFILKTPYKQYYFSCLDMRINELINTRNYPMALNEISKYREKAFRLKSNYGILESYNIEGGLYYSQEVYRYALTLYRKAADYAEKIRYKDRYRYYKNVALAALRLHRFDEAEEAAKKSIRTASDDETKAGGYCALLSVYCLKDTSGILIKRTYEELKDIDSRVKDKSSYRFSHSEAMYNYFEFFLKDRESAIKESMSGLFVPDSTMIYLRQAQSFEAKKDIKRAAENYINYCNHIEQENINNGKFLLTAFVPQIDFDNIEVEKGALKEKKARIKLKQLQVNGMLLKLKAEKNRAYIIKRDKEHSIMLSQLASKQLAIRQQNRLLENSRLNIAQQHQESLLSAQKDKWRNTLIISVVTALFILLCLYIVYKRKEQTELKNKKTMAERAERTKSLFFQNMNHEIRSPLNSIIGFNELLCSEQAEGIPDDEKEEIINMISTNSNLLVTLVNDVLDLSNLESGSYHLNWTDSDIQHLCRTAIESVRGRQADGVELRLKFSPDSPYLLYTDEQRLQQILINYLTNACKYTERGSITLAYKVMPGIVRFSVTDTGRGIKTEEAGKLFERFSMLDKAKIGNGLGLHICKTISRLLKGNVYLDTSYTKGARFIFDHPVVKMMMALLFCCGCTLPSHAQKANKTSEVARNYLSEIESRQYDGKSIAMADTMILMAKRAKDTDAECNALTIKTKCYSNLAKETLMLNSLNETKKLSEKYRKYKYMFIAWSTVINYYLTHNEHNKAMIELKQFRVMIYKTHDNAGTGMYFYNLGTFYYVQKRFGTALSYYLKAINYTGNFEYSSYLMIGQCYKTLGEYDKAIRWLTEAIERNITDVEKINPLIALLESYSKTGQTVSAIRTEARLKLLVNRYPDANRNLQYYHSLYFFYKLILRDNEKAMYVTKAAGDDQDRVLEPSVYYYGIGDYNKAYQYLKKDVKDYTEWLKSDPSFDHNYYISQFDYRQAISERNALAMRNLQSEIDVAGNSKKILLMKNEKSDWELLHAAINNRQEAELLKLQDLKLQSKKTQLNRQYILKRSMQKQKEITMERSRYRWTTLAVMAIFIMICITIVVYHYQTKEKILKKAATDAQEAEKRKNDFFESINKDIRRPLNTIINLNKKLNITDKKMPKDKKMEMMDTLRKEAGYLQELVTGVLEISKLESGTYKLKMEDINVYDFCNEIIDMCGEEHIARLSFIPDERDKKRSWRIVSDHARLTAVIKTYIKMALKQTKEDYVCLSYLAMPDSICFIITNTAGKNDIEDKDIIIGMQMAQISSKLLKAKTYIKQDEDGNSYIFEVNEEGQ